MTTQQTKGFEYGAVLHENDITFDIDSYCAACVKAIEVEQRIVHCPTCAWYYHLDCAEKCRARAEQFFCIVCHKPVSIAPEDRCATCGQFACVHIDEDLGCCEAS